MKKPSHKVNRQLVVCLDGTANRFSHRPTNVVRLLRSLPRNSEEVLYYYDQGVGTFGLKETLFEWQKVPSRVCGLAFGWGFTRNVEGAYRFLAENLVDGDDVFVFGFSRGAYAARALAALIRAVGLVRAHETHLFDYAWSMLLARSDSKDKPDFELQARFKATFGRPIKIRFLGLFDTVKSLGWVYDPVVIPYTTNNPIVETVRHAVSIDERRCFFRKHLWHSEPSEKTDVKQVWFAGFHSDIGGGYPPEQSHLALVAFRWMLGEALAAGLHIDAAACRKQMLRLNQGKDSKIDAEMHDSMTNAWKMAEWLPRMVWSGEGTKRSWQIGTLVPLGTPRPRLIPKGALLHRSVEQRRIARRDYKPSNIPKHFIVADDDPLLSEIDRVIRPQ